MFFDMKLNTKSGFEFTKLKQFVFDRIKSNRLGYIYDVRDFHSYVFFYSPSEDVFYYSYIKAPDLRLLQSAFSYDVVRGEYYLLECFGGSHG